MFKCLQMIQDDLHDLIANFVICAQMLCANDRMFTFCLYWLKKKKEKEKKTETKRHNASSHMVHLKI